MKSIKMALLAGAAVAVTAAAAHADDLDALKAQIETLNARVAAMETAPSVPAGYQLLAVSEVDYKAPPGMNMSSREQFAFGPKATQITVLPTADAPAGATISWSGYVRAGIVTTNTDFDGELEVKDSGTNNWTTVANSDLSRLDSDDLDVPGYARVRVDALTGTAVGDVGVAIRMEADFDGSGDGNVDMDVAWGWWQMTPELAFGGGYYGSLSNMDLGADGFNGYLAGLGDVFFSLGDRSQLRLTYGSGPLTAAISLEDTSAADGGDNHTVEGDRLGMSGRIGYAGDAFSMLLTGGYHDLDEDEYTGVAQLSGADDLWMVAAGVGFDVTDMMNLSVGVGMGEGNYTTYDPTTGDTETGLAWDNSWWGVNALASINLTDQIQAEIGAGYKVREANEFDFSGGSNGDSVNGTASGDAEILSVAAGLYYTPVDPLTLGVEAAWTSTEETVTLDASNQALHDEYRLSVDEVTTTAAFVGIWRF